MITTLQVLSLGIGVILSLVGFIMRGVLVLAMSRSYYYDRFSYLATWVLISPAILIGLALMWLALI